MTKFAKTVYYTGSMIAFGMAWAFVLVAEIPIDTIWKYLLAGLVCVFAAAWSWFSVGFMGFSVLLLIAMELEKLTQ